MHSSLGAKPAIILGQTVPLFILRGDGLLLTLSNCEVEGIHSLFDSTPAFGTPQHFDMCTMTFTRNSKTCSKYEAKYYPGSLALSGICGLIYFYRELQNYQL